MPASESSHIHVGGAIPSQCVKENDPDSAETLVLTGKNVLVGVPGAFTSTCHTQVPGYIEAYEKFKAKGVDEVYVFTVNDVHVTKAWKQSLAPGGTNVRFIADDRGSFAKIIGLSFDATVPLGGLRSKRYVITTENDKVTSLVFEEDPNTCDVTSAGRVLAKL